MDMHIALVPGDGIGPEIVREAVRVLDRTAEIYGHRIEYSEVDAGGVSIDKYGVPLRKEALEECLSSDAVLLGAVGGPKWDGVPGDKRPEKALLGLRSGLGLYTNMRPAVIYPELSDASPLKSEIIASGIDILILRELTGGIYFGERGRSEDGESAYDTMSYSKAEIRRIALKAFESARLRKGHVTLVDKANVLESSRLWRETVSEMGKSYPDVTLDYMYVDNASMQLVRNPSQFDVILTENMFGDILSDEASMITGSIGMLPSASLGDGTRGMYEPIHGSAPDIAGKNVANPTATLLSVAMMLRYSFSLEKEARAIENAVKSAISDGVRTADIAKKGEDHVGTDECGSEILRRLV